MALEWLLLENGVKRRTGREQRILMMKMGRGNWRKIPMKPCKICDKPFNSTLNKMYCSVKCMVADPDRREVMRRAAFKQMQLYKQHSNTTIERRIKEFLIKNDIKFEQQYRLGNWSYDFFIPKKILIEVDGDYWHANPKVFNRLNATQLRNTHNDELKKAFAIEKGYILIRVWENDIKNRWKEVEDRILAVVKND
jgi:very-short-patch-repair endonuclease